MLRTLSLRFFFFFFCFAGESERPVSSRALSLLAVSRRSFLSQLCGPTMRDEVREADIGTRASSRVVATDACSTTSSVAGFL